MTPNFRFYCSILLLGILSAACTESNFDYPPDLRGLNERNSTYLEAITGGSDAVRFSYEGDEIVRGYSPDKQFEIFYNNDGNVSLIKLYETPTNSFNFDLLNCTICDRYTYEYSGNDLVKIFKNGIINFEFGYYDDQRLKKIKQFEYDEKSGQNPVIQECILNYSGRKMTGMSVVNTPQGGNTSRSNQAWIFDEKLNPFYVLWKKLGFVLPPNVLGRKDFGFRFFHPHNLISVKESGRSRVQYGWGYLESGLPDFFEEKGTSNNGRLTYREFY